MRFRNLLLVLAIAAVGLFALLNWPEITRPTQINLGLAFVTGPLGLVLLGLLGLAVIGWLVATASAHSRQLAETRQHAKALQSQRELAERAEASRFTDLRTQLEAHLRELRQRDTTTATEIEQGLSRLRNQLDQLQRSMHMRMGEMEARLDARMQGQGLHGMPGATTAPVHTPAGTQHVDEVSPVVTAEQPGPVHPAAARVESVRENQREHRAEERRDELRTPQAAHGPADNDRRDHDRNLQDRPRAEPVADEPPRRRGLFDRLR